MVRMTRKWLDEAGLPTCGCGGEMVEEEGGRGRGRRMKYGRNYASYDGDHGSRHLPRVAAERGPLARLPRRRPVNCSANDDLTQLSDTAAAAVLDSILIRVSAVRKTGNKTVNK